MFFSLFIFHFCLERKGKEGGKGKGYMWWFRLEERGGIPFLRHTSNVHVSSLLLVS
jgi:hypothetical protein